MGKKVILLLLLLLFPLGELARFSFQNDVAISLNDMLVGLLLILSLFANPTKIFLKNSLAKPIGMFLGILALSLLANITSYPLQQIGIAALYILRFAAYAALYFIISGQDQQFSKKIQRFMLFGGGIFVLFGYIQYFFYPNLRNLYYAGWDEHLYRMFSTFLDPNFAGAFFVMLFLFVLGLLLKKNNILSPFFLSFLAILTLGAIFLTYSRSAYLMLGISMIVFCILQKQTKILLGFFGLALLVPILLSLSPKSEGTNIFRTASLLARTDATKNAFVLWTENPLFGVGFDAYRYAQQNHGFLEITSKENHAGAGTDNSFLFVLATSGMVGLAAYFFMWYGVVKKVGQKHVLPNNIFLATLVGLFVDAIFINSLFYPFILEFLWIELALTDYTLP